MVGVTDGCEGTCVVEEADELPPAWLPPELLPPPSGEPTGLSGLPLEELLLGGGDVEEERGVWLLLARELLVSVVMLRFCGCWLVF